MASPELAIAKATLSATLFRADPSSLTRPAVDAFFPLVSSTLSQCSRPNVQKCKAWIIEYIWPSPARSAALVKYLAALSRSLQDEAQKPSLKRKRLHLLYVVNDVLHHVVKTNGDTKFPAMWENALPGLVAITAAFDNCPKHKKKIENLIDLWEEKQYFTPEIISKLRNAITDGGAVQAAAALPSSMPSTTSLKLAKDTPYILPSFHGDHKMAWYDLPAATWLPHLTPNSSKPMLPDLIKPIQLAPGPADKALVTAVTALLSDVERIFSRGQNRDNEDHTDLNELGERILLDEITGDVIGGETYYGWSRGFCKKMKQRRAKDAKHSRRGRSRSISSGYSRGRSQSNSPPSFKRRRLSTDSRDRSRSPSSRRRRHSRSYSRSRSPDRRHDHSRSRRSYSRSRSPPRRHAPPPLPPLQQNPYPPMPGFAPIPPLTGDFPIPPPAPAGYRGPWPPPPPPPPMGVPPGGLFPNAGMPPQMMAGWPAPPPPPPPPPQHIPPQYHHFESGRGRGSFRGRGRGGYDRGRGGW